MTVKFTMLYGGAVLVMAGLVWAPDALEDLNSPPVQHSTARQAVKSALKTEVSSTEYSGTKVCGDAGGTISKDGQQIAGSIAGRRVYRLSSALGANLSRARYGSVWNERGEIWYSPNPGFFGIETLSSGDGAKTSVYVGPPEGQGLKDLIGTKSNNPNGVRTIGTAIEFFNPDDDAPLVESFYYNAKLAAIEKKEFNHFTPANAMKWTMLGWVDDKRPYEWNYDWSKADKIADEIRARNSKINLHTLIWDTKWGIPQHLWNMHKEGVLTRKKMRQEMSAFIHKVVGRYGDIVGRIDVVNEDIYKEGGEYLFGRKKYLGDDYIAFSFEQTQKAIKAYNKTGKTKINPELMINDFNVLFSHTDSDGSNKADEYLKRISGLIKQGVKIDAIGMQSHIRVNEITQALDLDKNGLTGEEVYLGIKSNLKRFSDLGVPLMITELDVEEAWGPARPRGDSDFTMFYEVIGALAHDLPELTDVSLWGSSDATMRMVLDDYEDDPGIYSKNYARKPEYFSFLQGLSGNSKYNQNMARKSEKVTQKPCSS